ncbi:hypothetical protein FH965_21710 [Streptomyces spectabilis]|uniref:Uncharacterized protein n=1 Tax=Streptomyces spectabilis TaxID=68270 RepID=A0A516RB20_STRST|nr:hypothetical protein FH965_21710 [Streptomyces spectabilis]
MAVRCPAPPGGRRDCACGCAVAAECDGTSRPRVKREKPATATRTVTRLPPFLPPGLAPGP